MLTNSPSVSEIPIRRKFLQCLIVVCQYRSEALWDGTFIIAKMGWFWPGSKGLPRPCEVMTCEGLEMGIVSAEESHGVRVQ